MQLAITITACPLLGIQSPTWV